MNWLAGSIRLLAALHLGRADGDLDFAEYLGGIQKTEIGGGARRDEAVRDFREVLKAKNPY